MKIDDGTVKQGWAIPLNANKAHYFIKGKSLCRKWLFLGKIYSDEQTGKQLPDDCKACWVQHNKLLSEKST